MVAADYKSMFAPQKEEILNQHIHLQTEGKEGSENKGNNKMEASIDGRKGEGKW